MVSIVGLYQCTLKALNQVEKPFIYNNTYNIFIGILKLYVYMLHSVFDISLKKKYSIVEITIKV